MRLFSKVVGMPFKAYAVVSLAVMIQWNVCAAALQAKDLPSGAPPTETWYVQTGYEREEFEVPLPLVQVLRADKDPQVPLSLSNYLGCMVEVYAPPDQAAIITPTGHYIDIDLKEQVMKLDDDLTTASFYGSKLSEISFPVEKVEALTGRNITIDKNTKNIVISAAGINSGNIAAQLTNASKFAYYKPEELPRYFSYLQNNPSLGEASIVERVNIGLDLPFYEEIKPISSPEGILVLCNKYNQLAADYVPQDLVDAGNGMKLKKEAAAAFEKMRADMKQEGYGLTLRSAYRSYETQNRLYNNYVRSSGRTRADTFSARPGHSEHQTGLALDIVQPGAGGSSLSSAKFENTQQYRWLLQNASAYGFILRYPKDGEAITGYMFEPWHWRYVGEETAVFMKENGIGTFDEYCALYQ